MLFFNKGRRVMPDVATPTEGFTEYLEACRQLREAAEQAARGMAAVGASIMRGIRHPAPQQSEVDALCARTKALGVDVRRLGEAVAAAAKKRLRRYGHSAAVRERVRWEIGEIERAGQEAIAPIVALQESLKGTPLGRA